MHDPADAADRAPSRSSWVPTSILCPVDFSETSRGALRTASDLARLLGASLRILHVVDTKLGFPVVPAHVLERLRQELHGQGQESLDRFVGETLGEGAPPAERQLGWGSPPVEILREVEERAPGLVVLGAEGRSILGRFAMGSVAEKVVRLASVPVLTVRHGTDWRRARGDGEPPRRVLVGCDFSEHAARALPIAESLAAKLGAALDLVHVVVETPVIGDPTGTPFPADFWTQYKRHSREKFDEWVEEHLPGRAAQERRLVSSSSAADGLVEEARRSPCDLIVLATHGWGWLHRAVLGSTTSKLLRRSPCPVLTLRPEECAFEADESPAGG